ncbi:MAG: prolipoprotein diacylglyceryl transferase [Candidatus Omnitrophica bacterium]|nr:prolipoprotein diacylglyceryl transferase [Candidatus Omnitrophota bacterium]
MHRILFQIGPITLYSYGLCIAIGFLISAVLILKDSEKFDIPKGDMLDVLIAVLVGGLIGGRLLFVLINWKIYLADPLRVLMVYEGGLAFQGAFLMAVFTGAVFAKRRQMSFFKGADLIAPYIAFGQAVGRIGCFLNGCCYGKISTGKLTVVFPHETVARIPVQLYTSFALFLLFIALSAGRKKQYFDGQIFALYLILYSLLRFFIDFLRGDNPLVLAGLKLSQVIGIGTFVCGAAMYAFLWMRHTRRIKSIKYSEQ